jgi:very-short-patch-repair endonuclease
VSGVLPESSAILNLAVFMRPPMNKPNKGILEESANPAISCLTLPVASVEPLQNLNKRLALWDALRHRQLAGLKFRCQHPVGQFILDFYCPAQKLVIEVDGIIHEQRKEYDLARTAQLNEFGYQVLRFTNAEVLNNLPDVLDRIRQAIKV